MKWNQTVADSCRYGEVARRIWGDWEILWENSESDYQGHASFLAQRGKRYCFYEWWYGSCSGCDGWEAAGKDDDAVEREMRETALWLDSEAALRKWLDSLEGNPASNASMKRGGGMAFGIDFMTGGLLNRINAIRSHLGMPKFGEPSREITNSGGGTE